MGAEHLGTGRGGGWASQKTSSFSFNSGDLRSRWVLGRARPRRPRRGPNRPGE